MQISGFSISLLFLPRSLKTGLCFCFPTSTNLHVCTHRPLFSPPPVLGLRRPRGFFEKLPPRPLNIRKNFLLWFSRRSPWVILHSNSKRMVPGKLFPGKLFLMERSQEVNPYHVLILQGNCFL